MDSQTAERQVLPAWTVIMPQKDLRQAKSRLALRRKDREACAGAMLHDTLIAVRACQRVTSVLVICERLEDIPAPVDFADSTPVQTLVAAGLKHNRAVEYAEKYARTALGSMHVAVLPADLPALDPGDLSRALDLAALHPRAFVRDAEGTGTTLLAARGGNRLAPKFGPDSASMHKATGATELKMAADFWSLRDDVDDLRTLRRALATGRAHHTRRVLDASPGALCPSLMSWATV